ncbi:MAG: CPBP family intramembrane metalloprotease [Chloroflexi bacterium]|nr:CPBP family intramembrane metalloprotease [Chloroflexota bacterium]
MQEIKPFIDPVQEPRPDLTNPSLTDDRPPRANLWFYAGLLLFAYLPTQLLLVVPLLAIATLFVVEPGMTQEQMELALGTFLQSELGLILLILTGGLAGVITIAAAFLWPGLWNRLSRSENSKDFTDWLAWYRPEWLGLWVIPLATAALSVVLSNLAVLVFGNVEVELQTMLFESRAVALAAIIPVALIAPLAEELVFRGALYNALLPDRKIDLPEWRRHLMPFVITSLAFTAVHLLAGFESIGSLILLLMLSGYLGLLRFVTGSVRAPVVAHMTWNLLAAIGLALSAFTNV